MSSCTYSVPDKNASGDNFYAPFLNDAQRTYFWQVYGFEGNKDYWLNGWGWDDDANTDKALARTFNACWALSYSAYDYQNEDYSGHTINWARHYVRDKMDDLQAHCGAGPNTLAETFTGIFVDDRTELYLLFFYGLSVIERTGCIFHESRHYDLGHNANFPPWSDLANAGLGQQADSSLAYQGAYCYEVSYLSWYNNVSVTATTAMRERARQRANWCLNNAFATHPGFTIAASSAPQDNWRWCKKCQGLAWNGAGAGVCPAGGGHDFTGSGDYNLIHGTYDAGQNNWRYCNKCHGLSFAGNATQGKCAAGGQHEHSGSWDFCMLHGNDHPMCQKNWHWCNKCQGMAFSGNGAGHCPAGGGHVTTGSTEYSIPFITS